MHILIVDDEAHARDKLHRLVAEHVSHAHVSQARDGQQALEYINKHHPELVFLDIQMPEMDGFAMLGQLMAPLPLIVFVTAFDQFALQAFDANAIDYLLKPYDDARFLRAWHKVQERSVRQNPANEQHLLLQEKGHVIVIRIRDIVLLEAADNYVIIRTGKQTHMMRQTLGGLQQRLGQGFVRCHRRYVVRADQIRQISPTQKGDAELLLSDNTKVDCSRQYREEVLQAVAGSS